MLKASSVTPLAYVRDVFLHDKDKAASASRAALYQLPITIKTAWPGPQNDAGGRTW